MYFANVTAVKIIKCYNFEIVKIRKYLTNYIKNVTIWQLQTT